jgi:DNA-binding PadR family transcriptional regulator
VAARPLTNPLALAVLACLCERPMHPYEMSTTLRRRRKELSIKLNYGSLYSVVQSLEKHGLIEPQETTREGRRPERTVYTVTDAGRTRFVGWLSELLSTPTKEFTQFEAGLSLAGALPPDDVAELLEERASRLAAEIHTAETLEQHALAQGLPRLFLVEAEFARAMKQAEHAFVTALVGQIRAGTLDGIEMWRRYHDEGVHPEETLKLKEAPRLHSI